MAENEMRLLSPTACLGYTPFDGDSFRSGLELKPDFIGADAGSPDSGPIYIATNRHYGTRAASKRDIQRMIVAGLETKTQVAIGGVNGFGSKQDVDTTLEIIQEIAQEQKLEFTLGIVYADVEKDYLLDRLQAEEIEPLAAPRPLTAEDVKRSAVIGHQMGPEPLAEGLATGADVVIAGRMCDDAIFAAPMISAGFDRGLALHLGKIIECAADASSVLLSGEHSMLGTIRKDHFLVTGSTPSMFVTPDSVAKHGLYERDHPYLFPGPGGINDISACVYEQVTPTSVKVLGSQWKEGPYKVRLEGAAFRGYRTMGIVGIRNETLIRNIDEFLVEVRHEVTKVYSGIYDPSSYQIFFHVYGRDAVMGSREPLRDVSPHEICLVTEVIADAQAIGDEICAFLEHNMLFQPYKGHLGTAGNLAHIGSVEVHSVDPAYEFSIDHLLPIDDPCELSRLEVRKVSYK